MNRLLLIGLPLLVLVGCSGEDRRPSAYERSEARREAQQTDRTARAAGRAAYGVAQESKKAAKTAGRVLRDAAREAREGWKEASRESSERARTSR